MQQILVVEDEADIRELLRFNLEREGFSVLEAADGPQALDMARRHTPALVLLDVMLPGLDGFEVCRRLGAQTETAHIPILMLTARGEEMDRVVGLSLGADDYVVKPFSVRELMLRVRAVLRRGGRETQSPALERHGIRLRTDAHTAEVEDTPLNLTATEFRLLEDLLRHAGTVRTREQLLNKVWGYSFEGYARTVDTHVKKLRSKMGEKGEYIKTVWGMGYKFEVDEA